MRYFVILLTLTLAALACRQGAPAETPTPAILEDTFFFGRALVDTNANGQVDAGDAPLEGARFTAMGFGAQTGKDGGATITIPGGWDQPVTAKMAPPDGGAYILIGPQQVELRSDGPTSADFLFAAAPTPAPDAPSLAQFGSLPTQNQVK